MFTLMLEMNSFRIALILIFSAILTPTFAHAQFDAAGFKQALKVKKNVYVGEASVSGGDRNVSHFRVAQIRVAANPAGYDRIVLELQGNEGGEDTTLSHTPFYMVENDPGNKRLIVTLYGKAKLDFSRQTAAQQARKAKHISKLEFLPIVDEDRWTWIIHTQVPVKTEIFELATPARIIIDLKP